MCDKVSHVLTPLVPPLSNGIERARYTIKPREKRFFHGALDASDLFISNEPATIEYAFDGASSHVSVHMPVRGGRFDEKCTFDQRFRPAKFERVLTAVDGKSVREERVDFGSSTPTLPDVTYPETMLPFILRGQSLGKDRRSVYAWICDRFVAKIYYEIANAKADVRVPAGHFTATEIVMYPDLNDWVKLGSVLSKLAKPFLPKYHMWFTDRLVRFEGPYGPPGAPEIVLELVDHST